MKQAYAVEARGVVQRYGQQVVLNQLDMVVPMGSLVALYGPSGSGKTTLLNLVGALSRPSAGEIMVLGRSIATLGDGKQTRFRRQHVGFIFQSPTLLPTYTAIENIDLVLRLRRLGLFERRRRTQAALAAVGLSEWADHRPAELSGGQQQRVAIARVLALQPPLILADEPTNGLDTYTARKMLTLFQQYAANYNTSFLIVSHDPEVVNYVDVAFDLHDGKLQQRLQSIVQEEPTKDFRYA